MTMFVFFNPSFIFACSENNRNFKVSSFFCSQISPFLSSFLFQKEINVVAMSVPTSVKRCLHKLSWRIRISSCVEKNNWKIFHSTNKRKFYYRWSTISILFALITSMTNVSLEFLMNWRLNSWELLQNC